MEQDVSQEYKEDDIEKVSIKSICMNKSQSMLATKLDTHAGNNKVIIPYKIDTCDGNIMPWYIFKNCSQGLLKLSLQKSIKTT